MTRPDAASAHDALIDRLAELTTARARESFLRKHRQLWDPLVVEQLYARVVRLARTDLQRAERLARAAAWIAEKLGDDVYRAQSLRAIGHVHHTRGEYQEALDYYEPARRLYQQLGRDVDVARTLNGALQSLISLGRYDEALSSAAEARAIFERHGNELGLARLDSNTGNILYRQDQFQGALALYQRAYEQLLRCGEPQDVAAALGNMAIAYVSLNDFQNAMATYREARAYFERHNMPLLVLRVDYNIADLYYQRGEYTRALDLYRAARAKSEELGDVYHSALCDLDRSEIYLELNLSDEAADLAEQARARFEKLGMTYEAAKAVTTLALTSSRDGDGLRSHELFEHARDLFAREGNQIWLGLLDFYEALILFRGGNRPRARQLARLALRQFQRAAMPRKAALCELLLARLDLQAGNLTGAERACNAALARLADADAPLLIYQAHCVLGLICEAHGKQPAAYAAFQAADRSLEHLRSHLQSEDLRVAFLEDKLDIYERLVTACLAFGPDDEHQRAAFRYMEKAKSRSLADLIAFRAVSLTPRVASSASDEVRRLRQELNWHYRQVQDQENRSGKGAARRLETLRGQTQAIERQLAKSLDELRRTDEEFSALESGTTFTLEEIRASLPPGTLLLEYYQAMGRLYVAILGADRLETLPLGPMAEVRRVHRLLQFQLAKFRLGSSYTTAHAAPLRAATEGHLRALYDALIAPIRRRLDASHLVIVPHDVLHLVPFHALFDGGRFLIDDFTISYAPSASVYRLCRIKPAKSSGNALVMGVPDAQAPFITDEVRAVAQVLPGARVFVGSDATSDQLQRYGASSRFVHIATHGSFRKDNPMFSSIRLGDGPLNVYDLYQLQLSAELVTLSGCGTGLSVVVGADEQLGLVRGLLYAGAQAVMLALWDAHDRSTADFMEVFYGRLQAGWSKAAALQDSMRSLREQFPHPFYWAPFTLIGRS
jgi:CHAT domain-containing protein/tetratricopeptide (TPR) repeat protein